MKSGLFQESFGNLSSLSIGALAANCPPDLHWTPENRCNSAGIRSVLGWPKIRECKCPRSQQGDSHHRRHPSSTQMILLERQLVLSGACRSNSHSWLVREYLQVIIFDQEKSLSVAWASYDLQCPVAPPMIVGSNYTRKSLRSPIQRKWSITNTMNRSEWLLMVCCIPHRC